MGKGNNSSFNCEDWLSGMLEALAERVSELVMQKMGGREESQTVSQTDASPFYTDFLSKKEVMEKFGVSASTLWHWSKDGYLVPPGDEATFAQRLCRLMDDEALRQSMGQAAIVSSQRYDAQQVMPLWKELFATLRV